MPKTQHYEINQIFTQYRKIRLKKAWVLLFFCFVSF